MGTVHDSEDPTQVDDECMWMLYKPTGMNTDMAPGSDMARFLRLLPSGARYHHIGRLDKETSGLLLFSCNGDDTYTILNSSVLPKSYLARVAREPTPIALTQLCEGVSLPDGVAVADEVSLVDPESSPGLYMFSPNYSPVTERDYIVRVITRDGRYRVVRRMLAAVGLPVLNLHRERVGELSLPLDMLPGELRPVGSRSWESLVRSAAGHDS
jgi:23S rRNA pseudouridine2605 synthase